MKLYVAFFKHLKEDNKIKYLINSIKGNYYKNVIFSLLLN